MELEDLYGLPLERFVPERDALARTLRGQGRRGEAETVAKLRKPSVAAWAVNQLFRTQRQAVADLIAAGDGLAQAHAQVVSGRGEGRTLRSAAERERAAVEELVRTARGLLDSEGHDLSPTMIDRVADTLHAIALDEQAREQVGDGRLERELKHVGLGPATGAFAVPAPPRAAANPSRAPAKSEQPASAAARAQRERAERDRAEVRRAARAAEAQARREHERAERALRSALDRRERAAGQLAEAEQALAQAQAQADAASRAHREARELIDRISA